jgi:hypothetical protein
MERWVRQGVHDQFDRAEAGRSIVVRPVSFGD